VILNQTMTQLGVHAAAVLLFATHTQTLGYAAGRGFRGSGITRSHLRLGEEWAGLAALERRLVQATDLTVSGPGIVRASMIAEEGFVAYHGVPLIAKGRVLGVLEVFHRTPVDPEPEWFDYLDAIAGQAAIAVDNATLFDDLQRSHTELAMAYDATIEGWAAALDLRDKETQGHPTGGGDVSAAGEPIGGRRGGPGPPATRCAVARRRQARHP